MGISITYMGTKRKLAPAVSQVLSSARSGILLDAFSGMCSVGEVAAVSRNIWNNDVQMFAAEVAKALFLSNESPPRLLEISRLIWEPFMANINELEKELGQRLEQEARAYQDNTLEAVVGYLSSRVHVGNSPQLKKRQENLMQRPASFPYCLASITYADGYFGLRQSIEIDSIRYALDFARDATTISVDVHRWLLIALCQAAAKVATTTGHFAQFLEPNSNNLGYYVKQRIRSVWRTWLDCIDLLGPIGSRQWREGNRVFNSDSLTLLQRISAEKIKPDVVYADPPYTGDQYSRYYHVWESLIKYDYPVAIGKGRYRADRFATPFSKKSSVAQAFEELVGGVAHLKAELVLSYPGNGILRRAGHDPLSILKQYYRKVEVAYIAPYLHSTLGASKGNINQEVQEIIYWAR